MSERPPTHAHEAPYTPPHESVEFDREIQYHQLIWMGVGLLVIAVISAVLVFYMLSGFVTWRAESAGSPPVMPPPAAIGGPQLLARPERELANVRREEAKQLESYGWVDPASGVAHIPIERAIDILATRGLPSRVAAAAPAPAATTATTTAPVVGTTGGETAAGGTAGGHSAGEPTPAAVPVATPPEAPR